MKNGLVTATDLNALQVPEDRRNPRGDGLVAGTAGRCLECIAPDRHVPIAVGRHVPAVDDPAQPFGRKDPAVPGGVGRQVRRGVPEERLGQWKNDSESVGSIPG